MSEGTARRAKNPRKSGVSLLGPGDPKPFETVKSNGRGSVLFVCDHAGRAIPAVLDKLGLDETVLYRHIAWDIGALEVARRLAQRFNTDLISANYSRLVIDPNRRLDDPTSIPVISDGVVVPGNRDLSPSQAALRADACFRPYHDTIATEIENRLARGQAPALISVHSFTPVFKGYERPWHFGVLWNRDGRIAEPLMDVLNIDTRLVVGDNQPYSGRDNYGYTVETHAEARDLPHVLIEIRQDLIDTQHGAEEWSMRLGDALSVCFENDPDLFQLDRG